MEILSMNMMAWKLHMRTAAQAKIKYQQQQKVWDTTPQHSIPSAVSRLQYAYIAQLHTLTWIIHHAGPEYVPGTWPSTQQSEEQQHSDSSKLHNVPVYLCSNMTL